MEPLLALNSQAVAVAGSMMRRSALLKDWTVLECDQPPSSQLGLNGYTGIRGPHDKHRINCEDD